jgi:1,4-alpha-glucan branching enzyme
MVSAEELDHIAAAEHPDPHAVLGPHVEAGELVIRVFRPDALAVRVLAEGAGSVEARRVHGLGIFEARLTKGPAVPRYRLEVRDPTTTVTYDDPYAFPPALGELDLHLAAEGKHLEIYRRLGAHVREVNGVRGTAFAVWAPQAQGARVAGDWNGWDGRVAAMRRMGNGIWEIFIPGVAEGALYKYEIKTLQGPIVLKSDPYGRSMELRPRTASRVTTRSYEFADAAWIAARASGEARRRPISIYEVHLGSWRIKPLAKTPPAAGEKEPSKKDPAERWYGYRELADMLAEYVTRMGFTHVELLPVMEHPYDGSWGYQVSGYFAPTSRYGTPDDFRWFVDRLHAHGIGVILDWTPAHFPKDAFALGRFDGSALYEHLDPRLGEHKHWNTYIFNYGRPEVKNFLLSNALYWIDEFHVDGLRVDAVASMLYLDYGASGPGDWVPNRFGGRENLDAVAFVRELCERVHAQFPGALVIAEESTSWPAVTRPAYVGGLGFDFKWNMGWMHDTLDYMKLDPIHRAYHHGKMTFSIWYAFGERFLLPLSHDEVVHLKRSLFRKMPGDRASMHANLRLLYAYMWAHPGKKLLFMGGEIGQRGEWNFESELEWGLLDEPDHAGLSRLVRDLNQLYRKHPALHELDDEPEGFRWIDCNDAPHSVLAFVRFPSFLPQGARRGKILTKSVHVVCVASFTPVVRRDYRIGVPRRCAYLEVLNTDSASYGGGGIGNLGRVEVEDVPCHGFPQSIVLTLPPLSALWLVPELDEDPKPVEPAAGATAAAASTAEPPPLPAPEPDAPPEAPRPLAAGEMLDETTLVSLDRRPAS